MQPISHPHNTFPASPINPVDPNHLNAEGPASQVDPRHFQQEAPHIELDPGRNQAESKLYRVIRFGNKYDLPKLLDEAISAGAQLNHPTCFESNSLVIAVRAKNFQAISPLMARGALIPAPAGDQVDLLIEACRTGDVNMAIELINVAKIYLHAQDATGKTALHYSVMGGSQELTLLLLSNGADPNVEATQMTESECSRIFGDGIWFQNLSVTPLMIAVRLGDDYLVHLLLSHGANPNKGACSPLIIAAFPDKPDIFNRLLRGAAKLAQCRDYRGHTGLSACVASRMPVHYLSQLISHHDFSRDNGSIFSPLGMAVERGLYDTASLLLACGAPIEDHETTDEPITIWQAALSNGRYGSATAELLTAKNSAFIETQSIKKIANQLLFIFSKVHHPEALSSKGYFTSMLFTAAENTKSAMNDQHNLSDRQKILLFASILNECLPKTLPPPPPRNGQTLPSHVIWQNKTTLQVHQQREALKLASSTLLDHTKQKITETTRLAFFQDQLKHCPTNIPLDKFISQHLKEELGIPDVISRRIGNAWFTAMRWSSAWHIASVNRDQLLKNLSRNLLRKAADEPLMDANRVTFLCKTMLDAALPRESQPLHLFHCDPVAWLYRLETRKSLADPSPDLAYQCQIELGLPLATCVAIVDAWRQSIRSTRDASWNQLPQLLKILNRQLASRITDALVDEEARMIICEIDSLMLQMWLQKIRNSEVPQLTAAEIISSTAGGQKRSAEQEATEAPPTKERRTE